MNKTGITEETVTSTFDAEDFHFWWRNQPRSSYCLWLDRDGNIIIKKALVAYKKHATGRTFNDTLKTAEEAYWVWAVTRP